MAKFCNLKEIEVKLLNDHVVWLIIEAYNLFVWLQVLNFTSTKILVLDEVDTMLQMGFEAQVSINSATQETLLSLDCIWQ